jgi:hypothetical protein
MLGNTKRLKNKTKKEIIRLIISIPKYYLKSKRTSRVLLTRIDGATTLRWIPIRKRNTMVMLLREKRG